VLMPTKRSSNSLSAFLSAFNEIDPRQIYSR
jgi:hypothetical protein